MEGGFLDKSLARIPLRKQALEIVGGCFVQLDIAGTIVRYGVYGSQLVALLEEYRQQGRT